MLFFLFILLTAVVATIAALSYKARAAWFALMCAVWIAVNSAVGWWLWQHVQRSVVISAAELYTHVQNMMITNLVLDVLYMLCGFWLLRLGRTNKARQEMLQGFGVAVIFQGAGLFIIDLIFLIRLWHPIT